MRNTIATALALLVILSTASLASTPEPAKELRRMNRDEFVSYIAELDAHIQSLKDENAQLLKENEALRIIIKGGDEAGGVLRLTPHQVSERKGDIGGLIGARVSGKLTVIKVEGSENGFFVQAEAHRTVKTWRQGRVISVSSDGPDPACDFYFKVAAKQAASFSTGTPVTANLRIIATEHLSSGKRFRAECVVESPE